MWFDDTEHGLLPTVNTGARPTISRSLKYGGNYGGGG
jgi:hypothetical protein